MAKFKAINTQRVQLRDFTIDDLVPFAAYRNDPDIARYQSWTSFDMDKAKAFFAKLQALDFGEDGSWYQIAIADLVTDKLLGDCVIHFVEGDAQQVEIGFTLAREHQGKGIAKEAMRCLIGFIFDGLKKHRIVAVTDVLNKGSIALLESLKFRQEAHFVENIFFNGSWGSEYMYALLRREYS